MSKWKDAYTRYRDLESKLQCYRVGVGYFLFRGDPLKQVKKLQTFGLKIPEPEVIKEILDIRQIVDEAKDYKFPLEDVYHAALFIVGSPYYWFADSKANHLYRGQPHCWPIVPKLFRDNPTQNKIDSELTRLASLSEVLKHKYPQYNEHQRIAIAQHYSTEACVKTWLVDLTWNPWVALFFASLNGRPEDIGHIICFSRKEWEDLSLEGKNRLGAIRLIQVQGVPRIEAQEAAFLDGSHPDLIEQYVGAKIKFYQHCEMIFEDPSIGITKEKLLPEKDAFLPSIAKWKVNPQKPTSPLIVKPLNDTIRPLQPNDYLNIALSWMESRKASLSEEKMDLLKKVCAFHARLQKERESIDVTARSLHRLGDAVDSVLSGEIEVLNLREAVKQYLLHADDSARLVVEKVLSEIKDNNSY